MPCSGTWPRPCLRRPAGQPLLIVIGRKLYPLLEDDTRVVAWLDGASVLEEVTSLLNQMVAASDITAGADMARLTVFCLYHGSEDGIAMQQLLPPFQHLQTRPATPCRTRPC